MVGFERWTGKCCSILHMKLSVFLTEPSGRMENAHFHIPRNTLCLAPKFCINRCFQMLSGGYIFPRTFENNGLCYNLGKQTKCIMKNVKMVKRFHLTSNRNFRKFSRQQRKSRPLSPLFLWSAPRTRSPCSWCWPKEKWTLGTTLAAAENAWWASGNTGIRNQVRNRNKKVRTTSVIPFLNGARVMRMIDIETPPYPLVAWERSCYWSHRWKEYRKEKSKR